ncbi:MAG: hypothetical protein M1834_005378 [Cirrosporium novae-zelandiae]|nr:MAG: hypothetical protein M1834_005378 [Cirrosporium novae-zelandiae]
MANYAFATNWKGKPEDGKAPRGLKNELGYQCYRNSFLQVLMNLLGFVNMVKYKHAQQDCADNSKWCMTCALGNLATAYWGPAKETQLDKALQSFWIYWEVEAECECTPRTRTNTPKYVKKTRKIFLETEDNAPKYLTVVLTRFSYNPKVGESEKNDMYVNIPDNLDLSEHLGGKMKLQYTLRSIINHSGGLTAGHYTSTVLGPDRN